MKDPGDGSIHQAHNITVLHYAGDMKFSYEEDAYNPAAFGPMIQAWTEAYVANGGTPGCRTGARDVRRRSRARNALPTHDRGAGAGVPVGAAAPDGKLATVRPTAGPTSRPCGTTSTTTARWCSTRASRR